MTQGGVVDAKHTQRVSLSDHRNTEMAGGRSLIAMATQQTNGAGLYQVHSPFAQGPTTFRSKRPWLFRRSSPTEGNIKQIARRIEHQHRPCSKKLFEDASRLLAGLVHSQTRLQ